MAEKKKGTKKEGVVYLSSAGDYFVTPEITAEKIKNFQSNVYGRGLSEKQLNLIFSEKYSLHVYEPNGEEDEETTERLTNICNAKSVRLWANMKKSYKDRMWGGMSVFNQVWDYEGNEYVLQKLRHLPWYSFRELPQEATEQYSDIMKGIILNDRDEIEFWQTQDDTLIPVKLKEPNIFWVRDPADEDLAGDPLIIPLVPVFERLNFVWNAQMQQSNRTGAKILFIKVTNPQPASAQNGNVGDIAYANKILENWGKNTAYQLRENMELIDPQIKDESNNLQVIEALNTLIIDYVSPISFITGDKEGGRLGGSDDAREELLMKYIRGVHAWIGDQFEMLLQTYLDVNGYKDYTVEIDIPAPSIDKSELFLKQGVEAGKLKIVDMNELREKMGFEVADEEMVAKIQEFWESQPGPSPETAVGFTMTKPPENVDRTTKNETEDDLDTVTRKMAEGILAALENEE